MSNKKNNFLSKGEIWDKRLPDLRDKDPKTFVYQSRKYYTTKEYEKMRKKILKKKLP